MTPRANSLTDRASADPGVVPFALTTVRLFDFYGFRIELSGNREDAVHEVVRDFAWFVAPHIEAVSSSTPPDMRIRMHFAEPPYSTLPSIPANVFTPRNVSFRHGPISYVDYFGRGLAIV